MKALGIEIKSRLKNYQVATTRPGSLNQTLVETEPAVIIADRKVWNFYQKTMFRDIPPEKVLLLDANEESKTLRSVEKIFDFLTSRSARKNMVVISVGGGIIQDITGFAASTIYRGVRWVYFPTTLLAMADSCIGAKTSLNFGKFKNLVGTFFAPSEVHICLDFLASLPEMDFASGVGEIAKLHLLGTSADASNYRDQMGALLKKDPDTLSAVIQRSLEIKKSFIEEDEFDTGVRNLLNYGHCFGHAIESATQFRIPHGLAVVEGMVLANHVARQRHKIAPSLEASIRENVLNPLIEANPTILKEKWGSPEIVAGLKKDKKRTTADLPLVMLTDAGAVRVSDMQESEAAEAVSWFQATYQAKGN